MFVEERKTKTATKFYLVHSYRDALGKVRKIRKYLGADLPQSALRGARQEAETEIRREIEELDTKVFGFRLSLREKEKLNAFGDQIRISHLNEEQWRRFTEDFVYNTNAIEGSDLAESEVIEALRSPEHSGSDEDEARGVAKAVEFIRNTQEPLTSQLILQLHRLCFEHTKDFAGEYRKVEVVIRDVDGNVVHRGIPVQGLSAAIKDLIAWYEEHEEEFAPLALAAIVHNQFEYIHPFRDGNGRVGRLLLNYVLLRHDYPPINIHFEDRAEYYRSLYEYSTAQDLLPTMKFLIKQYKKTLKEVTTRSDR